MSNLNILVHNDCISDELTRIANKYKNFECVDAANEMEKFLKKKGVKYKRVEIKFSGEGKYNNIWSEAHGMTISMNGYHTGIMYNGMIYDNLFKTGIGYNDWVNNFLGFGIRLLI